MSPLVFRGYASLIIFFSISDVVQLSIGQTVTHTGSATFSFTTTLAAGSASVSLVRVSGIANVDAFEARCNLPTTVIPGCSLNLLNSQCSIDISPCNYSPNAVYFITVQAASSTDVYNITVTETALTSTDLSSGSNVQQVANSSQRTHYFKFTPSSTQLSHLRLWSSSADSTINLQLAILRDAVTGPGCLSTRRCTQAHLGEQRVCDIWLSPSCLTGTSQPAYYVSVYSVTPITGVDTNTFNLTYTSSTPSETALSTTPGDTTYANDLGTIYFYKISLPAGSWNNKFYDIQVTYTNSSFVGSTHYDFGTSRWAVDGCASNTCDLISGTGGPNNCASQLLPCDGVNTYYFSLLTYADASYGPTVNLTITLVENTVTLQNANWGDNIAYNGSGVQYYHLPSYDGYGKVVTAIVDNFGNNFQRGTLRVSRGGLAIAGACGGSTRQFRCDLNNGNTNCTFTLNDCEYTASTGDFYIEVSGQPPTSFNFTVDKIDGVNLNATTNITTLLSQGKTQTYRLTAPSIDTFYRLTTYLNSGNTAPSLTLLSPTTSGCGVDTTVANTCNAGVCTADITCVNSTTAGLQVSLNGGGQPENITLDLDTVSIATIGNSDINVTVTSAVWYRIDPGNSQALSVYANVTAGSQLQMRLFQECSAVGAAPLCSAATLPDNCRISLFTAGTVQTPYYLRLSVIGGPDATVRLVRGSSNCFTIAANDPNLNFCKDVIAPGQFGITDVATADAQASVDFNDFYILYQGACNSSIKSFVCKENFPSCSSTGAITRQCLTDCQNSLSGCPSNYCFNSICARTTQCGVILPPGVVAPRTTPTAGSGGSSLIELSFAAFALSVLALLF